MNVRLVFALCLLLFFGVPPDARSSCADCLNAADQQVRQCLDNAIGPNERIACLENQQAQIKACSDSECKIEREEIATTEAQPTPARPGLAPYIPTEGEWLALIMRAGLRREASPEQPYSLDILLVDPETLQIVVRYQPTVDRDSMNKSIAAARETIRSTARSHGWDRWVKIRESVELAPTKK